MQRLRIRFSRGEEVKYISHLDLMRFWERALRRARVPLAYSEGFSPHPRISLAAPLALGVTSEAELMDITVTRWVTPHWFTSAVSQQLPPGIKVLGIYQTAMVMPSLQSQVRLAEYSVVVDAAHSRQEVEAAIDGLLALEDLPWHHQRDTGERKYNLRALVDDIWISEWTEEQGVLGMRLRCDSGGSGRPEQVALALGLGLPRSIHRTKLLLSV
jgi:radical SAM-linked protein